MCVCTGAVSELLPPPTGILCGAVSGERPHPNRIGEPIPIHPIRHTLIPSYTQSVIHSYHHTPNPSYTDTIIHPIRHTLIPSYTQSVIHSYRHTPNPSYTHTVIHPIRHTLIPSYSHTAINQHTQIHFYKLLTYTCKGGST